jgi:hypothetical protein
MTNRTNQYQDKTLKPEMVEHFGSLRQFAKGTGIPYAVLSRVVNNNPASTEEIEQVLTNYFRLSPPSVHERHEKHISTPHTVEEHVAYTAELYRVVCDLYAALKKTPENLFS